MKRESAKHLVNRWTPSQTEQVTKWLVKGCRGKSPVSRLKIAGREYWDCRGLKIGTITTKGLAGVDLSFGAFNSLGVDISITNCRFISTKMWGNFAVYHWRSCDFTDTNMRGSDLSATSFIECKMDGANLQRIFSGEVDDVPQCTLFERCSLIGAKFQQASMGDTRFVECNLRNARFGGAFMEIMLQNVTFVRCKIAESDIDWGGADTSLMKVEE